MKKKEIKKMAKKLFAKLDESYNLKKKIVNKNKYYAIEDSPEPAMEEEYMCEYDELVSEKFKKLFINIIKYPDNLRLSYTTTSISIEVGNIKSIKKGSGSKANYNSQYGNVKSNGEEQLTIYIVKDKCFSITQGYSRTTKYKDTNMYNDLIEIAKDKVKEINADNFNSIWEDISKESGILRDSNLDEILNDVV